MNNTPARESKKVDYNRRHDFTIGHHWTGCCQTDENQSQFASECRTLWRTNLAPLGESSGSVGLESVSAIKCALLVEMVVDGGMNGGEFL